MRAGILSQPDQSIGFHYGELVVTPEDKRLAQGAPAVEVLDAPSMVTVYEDISGQERGMAYRGLSWNRFQPGDRVLRIETGSEQFRVNAHSVFAEPECGGEVTQRALGEKELLVVNKRRFSAILPDETMLVPAAQPLPGTRGDTGYELLGVLTAEGGLLGFGYDGKAAREMVDMCLAMQRVRTPMDAMVMNQYWGIQSSLVRTLEGNKLAMAYLQHWKDDREKDYFPTMEPGQLWERVGYPDQDVIDRFSKTGGAVVSLANS